MKKINVIILLATTISASSYGQDTLSISKANLWQKVADKIYKLRLQTKSLNPRKQTTDNPTHYFTQHISHTAIATNNPLMAFGLN
jgi:hypothetical protein